MKPNIKYQIVVAVDWFLNKIFFKLILLGVALLMILIIIARSHC